MKVDVRSSNCTCQKGNVDTSIKSIGSVCFQLKPDDFTVSVGVVNLKFQALVDTGAAVFCSECVHLEGIFNQY